MLRVKMKLARYLTYLNEGARNALAVNILKHLHIILGEHDETLISFENYANNISLLHELNALNLFHLQFVLAILR